jgi:hypothetical protein
VEFMKSKTTSPLKGPAIIPCWLLRRREVSHGAKLTYVWLRQAAGRSRVVRAHVAALAGELGEDEAEVTRFLAELREWGLIEAVAGGTGGGNPARCFMPFHPWMDESPPDSESTEGTSEGGGYAKREVLSIFSYEQCFEYATHVAEREAGSVNPIRSVRRLAGHYYWKGLQDEEMAAWFAAKEEKDRAEELPNVLPYKKQVG